MRHCRRPVLLVVSTIGPPKIIGYFFITFLELLKRSSSDDQNGTLCCCTLQEFCAEYRQGPDSTFRLWIKEIDRMFVDLSLEQDDLRWRRIQILWFCLDRFLDFVDPKQIRTTRNRFRSKAISPELKEIAVKRANQLGLTLEQT